MNFVHVKAQRQSHAARTKRRNNLPTAYEYYAVRVETVVYRIRASVHVGVACKGSPSLTFSTIYTYISRTQPSLRACFAARVEMVVYLIRASVHVGLRVVLALSSALYNALATVICPGRPAARAIARAAEKRGKQGRAHA